MGVHDIANVDWRGHNVRIGLGTCSGAFEGRSAHGRTLLIAVCPRVLILHHVCDSSPARVFSTEQPQNESVHGNDLAILAPFGWQLIGAR